MTTRGLSLFNPMNIMTSHAFTWAGEIKPTSDPEGRLCQFDTFINGIRAGALNLLAYQYHHGCKTIRQIINRYAPASENPTISYVAFVSDWVGVGADEVIDIGSAPILYPLCSAIIHFEQGIDFNTPYQIHAGVCEALGSFNFSS